MPDIQNTMAVLQSLMSDSFQLREIRKDAEAQSNREAAAQRKEAGVPKTAVEISVRTEILLGMFMMRRAHAIAIGIEAAQREIMKESEQPVGEPTKDAPATETPAPTEPAPAAQEAPAQ